MILLRAIILVGICWTPVLSYATSPQQLHRIVSLSPAMTAMLGELEQTNRLVGVTRYCQLPAGLSDSVRVVGGAVDPQVESILALKPDMVLASSLLPENIQKRFQALGIPVQRFRQDRLEDIVEQVTWLAEHTNSWELAQSKVEHALEILKDPQSAVKGSALLVFSDKMELAAGGNTYPSQVMKLAGLKNVAASIGQPWPNISHEWLIGQDPEWILVATDRAKSEVEDYKKELFKVWREHDIFSQLKAVRAGQIIIISDSRLIIPSMQVFSVVDLLRQEIGHHADPSKGAYALP
ncbi:MAG: helical backbone metal receptor [Verrucomicrobiota bacterium]